MANTAEQPVFIFAGGGTGGHLYPGLAVAEEVKRLCPEAKIVFACSDRAIDRRILDPLPHGIIVQPVKPLPRTFPAAVKFLRTWLASTALARDAMRDLKPAAVLGLGGFAAGPMVKESARRGIRTGLLNPDAVPGKANQFLARRVNVIFTQFPETTACFLPEIQSRVRPAGCPIRSVFARSDAATVEARRQEARKLYDLRGDRKTLVVVGGSQGAATINEAIAALSDDLDLLADQWQMLHIAGPGVEKEGSAGAARPMELPGPKKMTIRKLVYCDRMELAYAAADLALARAGAGTVAELTATATPSVVLPYPFHKDQQQKLNAGGLAAAGAAILCQDAIDGQANAAKLRDTMIPLMKDSGRLDAMRQAARGFGRPGAAQDVARWLLEGVAI